MPYAMFSSYFPDVAERETRMIILKDGSPFGLPSVEYAFLEMYCDEKGCDCRRVFWSVFTSQRMDIAAVIAYGWEPEDFYAKWLGEDDPLVIKELKGPSLNTTSPQSDLAPGILKLVEDVLLNDSSYIERVKAPYKMFREKIDGQSSAPKARGRRGKKKRRRK